MYNLIESFETKLENQIKLLEEEKVIISTPKPYNYFEDISLKNKISAEIN